MRRLSSRQAKAHAISAETKHIVFERDGGECVWCGRHGAYVFPDAHYIARHDGGLGIEQNILTLCRVCHRRYDQGDRDDRAKMQARFREYFQSIYPGWDETKLIYRKEK